MTSQELQQLVNYTKKKEPKYKEGQGLQVNEKTLQYCKDTRQGWEMLKGQYWLVTKYDNDENEYLLAQVKDNKIVDYMWFAEDMVDNFTILD